MTSSWRAEHFQRFLDDLVALGVRELVEAMNAPEASARASMQAVVDELCLMYGKQTFYIPAQQQERIMARDDAIQLAHEAPQDGPTGSKPYSLDRVCELAVANHLTERAIYKALNRVRARGGLRSKPAGER